MTDSAWRDARSQAADTLDAWTSSTSRILTSTTLASTHAHGKIDARSIVTLIVFFAVNILVIFPLRIPLPRVVGRWASTLRDAVLGLGAYDRYMAPGVPGSEEARNNGDRDGDPHAASESSADTTATQPGSQDGKDERGNPDSATYPPSTPGLSRAPSATHVHAHDSHGHTHPAFELGLATAPVAGVLLLLASTCIPGSVVRGGIVGGVRPYDIMTLFLSFAYISLSLDSTGLLRFLAFSVANRSSSSGPTLFLSLYALFVVLSLVVGNDPVVLSGTPFVAYFTTHASISPPTPFLFAQFQAANLASALLVSSNPTNLVLTTSFHMSFLSFSAWTALPTLAAAITLYPILRVMYARLIPHKITPPKVDPRDALTDPSGAVFTSALFVTAIAVLIGLSAAGKLEGTQGVWTVTAPAALLVTLRDGMHDLRMKDRREVNKPEGEEAEKVGPKPTRDLESASDGPLQDLGQGSASPKTTETLKTPLEVGTARRRSSVISPRPVLTSERSQTPVATPTPASVSASCSSLVSASASASAPHPAHAMPTATRPAAKHRWHPVAYLRHVFPTISAVVARLPLPLLPFAFSMFILVDALDHTGWVGVWARWWAAWARAGGTTGCVWLMGLISVLGCNILGTNIGVTVLLSRIMVVWRDAAAPGEISQRTLYGSVLALAVGSNFGAYSFVFSASLAGLLWRDILAHKGLRVGQIEFLRWNLVPLATTMVVACLIVAAEVCVMF